MPEKKPKPYTRYKSSRLRSAFSRPLRKDVKDASREPSGEPFKAPSGKGREPVPGPPSGRRWGRFFGWAILILLIALLLGAIVSYWRLDRAVRASNARVPASAAQALGGAGGSIRSTPVNILFLGSDERPGESARADTILLMRFDGKNKVISQMSIPRDTLAEIPGYGEDKINAAYAYGGPALQIATVEAFTGIPVHHYVELDFAGFPAIVDALGGVDIDVPRAIDSQYPQGTAWTQVHFDAGPQHMSGERALTYVRVRYSDDDFQRMGRQQQFVESLQKRMASPVNMVKMPLMAPEIVSSMTTDLSTNELLALAWIKFRTPAERNRKFVLIGDTANIDGGSYVIIDESSVQATVRDFLSSGPN